jgi:FSR family fosmidomycin resistance protein-like MFS transporter
MPAAEALSPAHTITFSVLIAISFCHLLNDMMQSLLTALYPYVKEEFALNFTQVGLISLTYQFTASLLQPLIGLASDKRPMPYSLAIGMVSTLIGFLLWSGGHAYVLLLFAAALVGLGSATFHPEAARVARMASGGRHGLAQSVFQVGGNFGQALGPAMAAVTVAVFGESSVAWFAVMALVAITILWRVGVWYKHHGIARAKASTRHFVQTLSRARVGATIAVLMALMFSKQVYLACMATYYIFYLIQRFDLPVQSAQLMLFVFLSAVAAGAVVGGIVGDRFGRKFVIWFSVLGVLPFTLALPHVDLFWTAVLSVVIGLILSSALPAILVYAQELLPGRVGMVSGLFFGFAFGLSGIGAAILGRLADRTNVEFVFLVCSFLPLLGLLAALLPNLRVREYRQPVATTGK